MACMARRFLEQMGDDPAQVDRGTAVEVAATLVERRCGGDDGIDLGPHTAIARDRFIDRRDVVIVSRAGRPICESAQHPDGLGVCHVVGQPQQRRAGCNGRSRCVIVVHARHLSHEGVTLVLQQRQHGGAIVTGEPGWLLILHQATVMCRRQAGAGGRTTARSRLAPNSTLSAAIAAEGASKPPVGACPLRNVDVDAADLLVAELQVAHPSTAVVRRVTALDRST